MKCIVKDCANHMHEGRFVGELCTPCHTFITTGEGTYSQAYRNSQRGWVGLTYAEISEEADRLNLRDGTLNGAISFANVIAAKLKAKNS